MKLVLTQIPKSYVSKFPPLYRQNPPLKTNKPAGWSMQDNNETYEYGADMNQIFSDCVDTSPFFWYSPVPNLSMHLKQMSQQLDKSTEKMPAAKNIVQINQEKNRVSLT
jgi:hypothetical protein